MGWKHAKVCHKVVTILQKLTMLILEACKYVKPFDIEF
jgi:hypothetical protein